MPATATPPPRSDLPSFDHYLAVGRRRGVNWTLLRRDVLQLLWRDSRPWGPYGLAKAMRKRPASLYRVLATLEAAGLIVAISSSRRVQVSPDPDRQDWAVLQCSGCARIELLPASRQAAAVREAATRHGHVVERLLIECVGRCRACGAPAAGRRASGGR